MSASADDLRLLTRLDSPALWR